MRRGAIAGELAAGDATEEAVMRYAAMGEEENLVQ
jgi:hypothetical protein